LKFSGLMVFRYLFYCICLFPLCKSFACSFAYSLQSYKKVSNFNANPWKYYLW